MYRKGITKGKARKLLADTGRYADIVYARRFAQGANSQVPSHNHHQQQQQHQQHASSSMSVAATAACQQQQQQPPLEVVSSEQNISTQE